MTESKKPTAKRVIELIIVLLTAVLSFLGGNVSANNGYKVFPPNTPITEICLK